MLINFWWFLSDFCGNWVKNSEKLDFAIKNRDFWPFFDTKFSHFLIIFITFLGSFWSLFGGYPSPSISAPLVVKKCLKLYIYNIGVSPSLWLYPSSPGAPFNANGQNHQNAQNGKTQKNKDFGFIGGRTRVQKINYPVNLPDMNI